MCLKLYATVYVELEPELCMPIAVQVSNIIIIFILYHIDLGVILTPKEACSQFSTITSSSSSVVITCLKINE